MSVVSVRNTTTLKDVRQEILARQVMKSYREDPVKWYVERWKGKETDFVWSKLPGYENHVWDGDKDPLAAAWLEAAKGNWVAIEACTGCHAKGQGILMFDGSVKKVEDIQEGDLLMGDDSTPRKVLRLFRGKEKMYQIIPVKGEPFIVNESHVLSLKKTSSKKRYDIFPDVLNVKLSDYRKWEPKQKHLYKQYRTGVKFKEKKLPYAPYLIGLWLGDGTFDKFQITNNNEAVIVNYLTDWASNNDYQIRLNASEGKCNGYTISKGLRGKHGSNLLKKFVQNCFVKGEKRIPVEYLTGSREQRLQMLAALIDTDGDYSVGCYSITTKYEGLKNDILYLVRSLGLAAYNTVKMVKMDKWDVARPYQRISISGDISIVPCKIGYKKAEKRKQIKRVTVTGFDILPLEEGDYYGFELDQNNLYLLDDFTVTHNSGKTYSLAKFVFWFLDVYPDSLVVTTAPKQDQLKLHLWAEIGKGFKKFKRLRPSAEMFSLRLKADNRPEKMKDDGDEDFSSSWQAVGFVAGVKAGEDSSTKAQGFHRKDMLIIMEECAGMPDEIMTAFQNTSVGGNNIIMAVGNPDSQADTLHRFVTSKMVRVKSFRISAFDFPNVVLGTEIIPGAVTKESILERKKKYGENSNLYQSRVRGISPKQSIDSLIMVDWVEKCINNGVVDNSYNALGVDVANSEGGDKAALVWGLGNKLIDIEEFHCNNATHLAYNVFYAPGQLVERGYTDYQTKKLSDFNIMGPCIGVDSVGVGVATLNAFTDMGLGAVGLAGGQWDVAIPMDPDGKPMWKFSNLRTQMYWELREDLREGRINIQITDGLMVDQIKFELCIPKVSYTNSYIFLESKENIKKRMGGKSPNVADAIAYWNWMRKGYKLGPQVFISPYGGG